MKTFVKNTLQSVGLLEHLRPIYRALRETIRSAPFHLRYAAEQWVYRWAANGLPIPPPELNFLVSAERSVPFYVRSGRQIADCIVEVLQKHQTPVESLRSVLDFGCGSGRVIRWWKGRNLDVHGSDLNPTLIRWCRSHLRFARFQTNGLLPPLAYPAGSFDLVYAMSVLTHLSVPAQVAWMQEWARVLRPGGYLFITTHGDHYLSVMTEAEQSRFASGQPIVRRGGPEGSNPYAAFQPETWVRDTLAQGLRVLDFLPRRLVQDVFLLQKPA